MIGVPEKTGGKEAIFEETTTEEFPIIIKIINPPIQGAKWTQRMSTRHMKKTVSSHILIILLKSMEKENKICKAARGKRHGTYSFLVGRSVRRHWSNLKVKEDVPSKRGFFQKWRWVTLTDIEMLKDYITSRPTLQETLKESSRKKDNHTRWESACSQRDEGQQSGNRMGR